MSLLLATDDNLRRRRRVETVAHSILLLAALACLAILVFLLYRLAADGLPHMNLNFWTQRYNPVGLRTGNAGILDAILASVQVLVVTMLVAIPIGTAAGVYLQEYAPSNWFTDLLRTTIANLAGVPSVVYGLLGLAIFVRALSLGSTLLAGSLTLAALILPILIVATEEALKTVPQNVRDASLAMGATKWQTIRHHVLPYALPGILTGNILALSRAAGETAPLLVIATPVLTTLQTYGLDAIGTPLQVRIYFLSQDASIHAQDMAAAAIVVLLGATLLLNFTAILLRQRLAKKIKW